MSQHSSLYPLHLSTLLALWSKATQEGTYVVGVVGSGVGRGGNTTTMGAGVCVGSPVGVDVVDVEVKQHEASSASMLQIESSLSH